MTGLDGRTARLLLLGGSFAAVIAISGILLAASGVELRTAAGSMVSGAFGSEYAVFSATLVRAIPLILTGLAVTWAFNAGVFNIGVEGQFLVGAASATAVALRFPGGGAFTLVLALVAGSVSGAAWAAIAAWLKVRFAVLEVISTIMLNFVAIQLIAFLVHGPLGDPAGVFPQSPSLAPAVWMPKILPGTRLHAGFVIAIVACVAAWYVRRATASGFRLRLAGANPFAAWVSGGVRVNRVTVTAFLTSGAIAGLAGGIEVTGVTFALYESISPGYGYTAIAIALLANLNPAGVIVAGAGFGALEAGAAAMQRDAGVPQSIVLVIQALLILLLAAAQVRFRSLARLRQPEAA